MALPFNIANKTRIVIAGPPIGFVIGSMNTQSILKTAAQSALANRILNAMDAIEYRRVRTVEDLEPVMALRAASYRHYSVYADDSQPMTDACDLDPQCFTYAIHYRDTLVATLRIHIVTAQNPVSNSVRFFPAAMKPLLDQGLTFMDPTRFAIDLDAGREVPGLPFIALRLGFLAAKHFATDYCLSMIREEHEAFYRRVFRATQVTSYTQFPVFNPRYALFSSPKTLEQPICDTFPLFCSTATERRLLFDAPQRDAPAVISVRPTAKLALRQRNADVESRFAAR
jgi:hypothetical protein